MAMRRNVNTNVDAMPSLVSLFPTYPLPLYFSFTSLFFALFLGQVNGKISSRLGRENVVFKA